jgi:hypothetical protein
MDNVTYHSFILNKSHSANSRKSETVDWLKKNNITVDPAETRAEVLEHVQPSRCQAKYMNWTKSLMNRVIRLYSFHHTIATIIP